MNLTEKYDIKKWGDIKTSVPPKKDDGEPVDGFQKLFNIPEGVRAVIGDYAGFQILFDTSVVTDSRKKFQPEWKRFSETLQKPSEVWTSLDKDNLPVFSYLKKYDDGTFQVMVVDGETKWFALNDDDNWAERQRKRFLVYTAAG